MSNITLQDAAILVENAARKLGVDPTLAKALLVSENTADGVMDPARQIDLSTTSSKGAYGIGQVMPDTVKGLIKEGYLPAGFTPDTAEKQAIAMVSAIKEMTRRTGDDPVKLAIHYNGGMTNLRKFIASGGDFSVLHPETQQYLQKTAANHEGLKTMLDNPYGESGDSIRMARSSPQPTGLPAGTSRSASTTTSTRIDPFGLVQKALGAGEDFVSSIPRLMGVITGANEAFEAEAGNAKTAQAGVAAAEQGVIKSKAGIEKQKLVARQGILERFGIDAADPTTLKTAELQTQAQEAINKMEPELAALRSVDLTKDPLGWLMAQVQIQAKSEQYNQAVQTFNNASAAISARQRQANAQIVIEPGVSTADIDQAASAEASLAAAQANAKLLDIDSKLRVARISSAQTELSLQGQVFRTYADMVRFGSEVMQLREHENAKGAEKLQLEAINVWRAKQGAPEMTLEEFKQLRPDAKQQLVELAKSGNGAIGNSPGQSLRVMIERQTIGSYLQQQNNPEAVKFVTGLLEDAQKKVGPYMLANRQVKTQEEALQQIIDKSVKDWRAEVGSKTYDATSPSNPLKAKFHMMAQAPSLKDNPLAQAIKAQPDGGIAMQEKDLLTYATAQVTAGKMTPAQAAGAMTEFMQKGITFQDSSLGLELLGFRRRNTTETPQYKVSGNLYGTWESIAYNRGGGQDNKQYDWFKLADVENLLTTSVVKVTARDAAQRASTEDQFKSLGPQGQLQPLVPEHLKPRFFGEQTAIPPGTPSIYAPAEEWARFRQSQQQGN